MQANDHTDPLPLADLNQRLPIQRILSPFVRFAKLEAAGGLVLLVATVAALVWANSPWAAGYDQLLASGPVDRRWPAMVHETLPPLSTTV